jgi:glyoxylase-like metal-dependent hydrolase (beta-lactamase superfamily II)
VAKSECGRETITHLGETETEAQDPSRRRLVEVAPNIHRIECPLGDRYVCLYLLVGTECALLVDTGLDSTPKEVLEPYFSEVGLDPDFIGYVMTSHIDFDHSGGNASIKEMVPDAVFVCHELDRRTVENVERMIDERYGEFRSAHGIDESEESKGWIRSNARHVPVDLALSGGEKVRLSLDWYVEILHTPGHSRGHLSIYDPKSRAAIIEDAVLYNSVLSKDGTPTLPPTYRYVETYLSTVQRIQEMQIETLLTGHYPVYRGDEIPEFLAESRAFAERVDQVLRDHLRTSAETSTMKELISTLGPVLGEWPEETEVYLAYPFQGHMERLERYGCVRRIGDGGITRWSWIG